MAMHNEGAGAPGGKASAPPPPAGGGKANGKGGAGGAAAAAAVGLPPRLPPQIFEVHRPGWQARLFPIDCNPTHMWPDEALALNWLSQGYMERRISAVYPWITEAMFDEAHLSPDAVCRIFYWLNDAGKNTILPDKYIAVSTTKFEHNMRMRAHLKLGHGPFPKGANLRDLAGFQNVYGNIMLGPHSRLGLAKNQFILTVPFPHDDLRTNYPIGTLPFSAADTPWDLKVVDNHLPTVCIESKSRGFAFSAFMMLKEQYPQNQIVQELRMTELKSFEHDGESIPASLQRRFKRPRGDALPETPGGSEMA